MKIFNCKSCGAPMVWITTKAGRNMPCDAQPYDYQETYKGKDTVVTEDGRVLKATILGEHVEQPRRVENVNGGVVVSGNPTRTTRKASNGLEVIVDGVGYKPHWASCPHAPFHRHTAAELGLDKQNGGGNDK